MDIHGDFAPAHWVLSRLPCNPATIGGEDESLDVCALRHVKRSYDGTVANELDVLLCERPHP